MMHCMMFMVTLNIMAYLKRFPTSHSSIRPVQGEKEKVWGRGGGNGVGKSEREGKRKKFSLPVLQLY